MCIRQDPAQQSERDHLRALKLSNYSYNDACDLKDALEAQWLKAEGEGLPFRGRVLLSALVDYKAYLCVTDDPDDIYAACEAYTTPMPEHVWTLEDLAPLRSLQFVPDVVMDQPVETPPADDATDEQQREWPPAQAQSFCL